MRAALLVTLIHDVEEGAADGDHDDRPELRGGNTGDEGAARIAAYKLNEEAEDAVGGEVERHVVVKLMAHQEINRHAVEDKEEDGLVEHGGVHGLGEHRELNTEGAVGDLTVAAAGEEATDTAEGVCDENGAGEEAHDVEQGRLI